MRYSESTGCFYPEWGAYDNLPEDIVVVSDEDLELVLQRPLNSKVKLVGNRVTVELESTQESRAREFSEGINSIDMEIQEADKQPFSYNGNLYYPDTEFIQGIFSVLHLLPENYTETWKTAEKSSDGVNNVYVTLDKAGIQGLALEYLQFKKNNWLSGEAKKQILKDAFLAGE